MPSSALIQLGVPFDASTSSFNDFSVRNLAGRFGRSLRQHRSIQPMLMMSFAWLSCDLPVLFVTKRFRPAALSMQIRLKLFITLAINGLGMLLESDRFVLLVRRTYAHLLCLWRLRILAIYCHSRRSLLVNPLDLSLIQMPLDLRRLES